MSFRLRKYLLPLILILFLAFTISGFCNWYLPTTYLDIENTWDDETLIYDDNDITAGTTLIDTRAWSDFIVLDTYSGLNMHSIKFLANYVGPTGVNSIDIDLYYNSQWNDLYEGVFDDEVWTRKDVIPAVISNEVRVRFYAKKADIGQLFGFEFENSDIDIGAAAINRSGVTTKDYTYVSTDGPANGTGKITEVKIYCYSQTTGCVVAIFTADGDNMTTRDYETVNNGNGDGVVLVGLQTFTVDLDVVEGDYIGFYAKTGQLEMQTSGGVGVWFKWHSQIPCSDLEFGTLERDFSVHGTGEFVEEGGTHVFFTMGDL